MSDRSRRDFIKQASAGLAAGVTVGAGSSAAETPSGTEQSNFRPAEYWRERMEPPDDGKKFGWFVDTRRCFGCHGCEVACKAENNVPLGHFIRQTFYKDVGDYPKVARMFMPMSCQHCEDAPCIKACPNDAISKGIGGSVLVDYRVCDGSGECVNACPYGAIYLDPVAEQAVKCHNCYHRLEHGLEPACASTCPSDAIYFGDLNDPDSRVSQAISAANSAELPLVQLRVEKNTKPRMWFVGRAPVEIEERIPTEGESYQPDAYDVYNWKQDRD